MYETSTGGLLTDAWRTYVRRAFVQTADRLQVHNTVDVLPTATSRQLHCGGDVGQRSNSLVLSVL